MYYYLNKLSSKLLPECFILDRGDTEESTNFGSLTFGQWTRRLRLPNASRPNHNVLDPTCK